MAHGLLIWIRRSLTLLLILPIAHVFLRIDLLLSFVVYRRNDTFILMFLVHHFELGYSFIGLIDALPAEVALTVDPSSILCIVLSLTPHIVCTHELLHDFIVFLMSTSLWMHLLVVGSMLV